MAYSTGSGLYTDLMAAVLSHAIADGWTEAGGVGTGWPIVSPSGRIRGVDWDSTTSTESDFTLGGDGLPKTQRDGYLSVGSTPAEATSNAATLSTGSGVRLRNFAYTIANWWIFSDISAGEYIHVVYNFSNGAASDVYSHFSFGEVDKGGLTYGSIAYATSPDKRGYAESTTGGTSSPKSNKGSDWNTLNRSGNMWAGDWGEVDEGWSSVAYMVNGTTAPVPNGVGGWPAWDSIIAQGERLWSGTARGSDTVFPSLDARRDGHFASSAWWLGLNAQTGVLPLMPIPFILINGMGTSARNRWMGVYPDARFCTMNGVNPEDEITFGSDTWKVFPVLRKTNWGELNIRYRVTSGFAGYAYKKVV